MKRFLFVFCGWLVFASANVRVYALAGDLDHPSLALPANAPAELHSRLIRILDDKDAKFLRGHFVNAHTTLEYGGSTDALNQMLTLRTSSKQHAIANDSPPVRDAAYWAKLDKELEFYYNAEYPGKELPNEEEEDEEDF